MPIHDWTRVDHGTFHDFHQGWAPQIRSALNNGLLPPDYEAKVEQHTDDGIPDVLALRLTSPLGGNGAGAYPGPIGGLSTVAIAPPKVSFTSEFASDPYTRLRKTITVRRDDRIVALIELVSPGNKSNRHGIQAFVRKVTAAIDHGIHVLVVDLFPPGPRDPNGVHQVIWSEFRDEPYSPPANQPLTLVSYEAGAVSRAYIQPVAVGEVLPEMPLFLEPGAYVNVPLEATYMAAFDGISRRTRDVLTETGR
ncbi:Uncharacterized protein OS=Candidatus Entotheonella sp. TSY1 GN=ETSY1_25480 PE=4 SV=1 [Gemmata massiliana]|uniref:DUF4058 domain-containing protein n=1 Tax=Gemmata massiliana TaxID=1210884 RepID=A0A6P2CVL5_9BACT|nr:DUF4058 family protein [Gemmata massiliana]VTR91754.1 Uncharacterized protein OS=Candidatus Entotheonella sp. TSY1 GN=ETSY1_25480 PE=4 SV=1 [Gemmata massiliana]